MWLRDFLEAFYNHHYTDDRGMTFVIFNPQCETLMRGNIKDVLAYAKMHWVKVNTCWTVSNMPGKGKYDIAHCIIVSDEE